MALAPAILIIAGTDSSGGAGVVRDIETAAHFGVATALAVTAVTAQTHDQVWQIAPIAAPLLRQQIISAMTANSIGAVKIGMIGTAEATRTIAETLQHQDKIPVILDPVLAASSEDRLTCDDLCAPVVQALLPLVTLITPNRAELAQLTMSEPAQNDSEAIRQGEALIQLGACAVLVKGGHAVDSMAHDYLLVSGQPPACFSQKRLKTGMRGTGCTLATAIAAQMARGFSLHEAVAAAKQFVYDVLESRSRP